MADCVQIMKENSQAIFFNLKKTNFALKNATKACLENNDGSILCVETTDVDVTRVLLVQVLINLEKDTILNDNNLNEILFTDFSSFTTMTSGQNENFKENFPDLLVCILDNEEELSKQSHILESWINIIKLNGQKIIFIMKNPKHLEKIIMDNQMANIFNLKVDKLWKQNNILSNDEAICEVENNLVNIEWTSARALDDESSGTSSHSKEELEEAENVEVKELVLVAVDRIGNTQLHLASRDGHTESVNWLLSQGGKKDVKNKTGRTALHMATEKGHSAIVQMLLEDGFNVNATDKYDYTSLHLACIRDKNINLIKILLEFGAQTEREDALGHTALHWASQNCHSAVVTFLLENSANINAQNNNGDTPLHKATLANKEEVVLILLQHGALLNIKNKREQNVLQLAKFRKRTKIIQILENHK